MNPISPSPPFRRRAGTAAAVLLSAAALGAAFIPGRALGGSLRPVLVHRASLSPTVDRADAPRTDTAFALHLLRRATFGVRPRDLDEVLRMGPQAWLDGQLHPERIDDAALDARIAQFPAASMTVADLYAAYPQPTRQQREARARADSAAGRPSGRVMRDSARMTAAAQDGGESMSADSRAMEGAASMSPDARNAVGRPEMRANRPRGSRRPATPAGGAEAGEQGGRAAQGPQRILFDLAGAKVQRAVYSQRQLQEVMTDFWFNHFNVFWGKAADRYLVADYERTAIRPHVFGRFEDLLLATARHPAMLVYLDNAQSTVPDSLNPQADRRDAMITRWRGLTPAQRQAVIRSGRLTEPQAQMLAVAETASAGTMARRRTRGLNENYARELMELHTLGVDGGYTQHDVGEVARAFTGWSVQLPRRRGRGALEIDPAFVFRGPMHDQGEKTVLGHRLPAGRGEEDGREVLHLLATSPATARHIARQLAERFVADDPPPALVERLAQTFLRTGGDLREVTRALFLSPEFADPRLRTSKVKTPVEFVAGALRATGADVGPSRGVLQALRGFGQVPYLSSPPTGYPNRDEAWTNSGAMLSRMNFGLALAAGRIDGAAPDPAVFFLGGMPRTLDDAALRRIVQAVLPGPVDESLLRTLHEDLSSQNDPDPRRQAARALGLVLGSPNFQRR
ncbi:MAG: hypothetical protein JWM27_3706 [Gemmatimonadetes bacterium]|nr:hypothetical protein [Gemmatimonadota bacterium]